MCSLFGALEDVLLFLGGLLGLYRLEHVVILVEVEIRASLRLSQLFALFGRNPVFVFVGDR